MSSSADEPVAELTTDVERLLPLADSALGLTALVGHLSGKAVRMLGPTVRPVVRLALRPPVVPARWQAPQVTAELRTKGGRLREDLVSTGGMLLDRLVPLLLEQVLRRVDVTEVVVTRVDLDAVAAGLDVDAVAARLDVDAVVGRVDLAAIAMQVIEAVDLPEVIRESSGAMASDTVREARMRGIAGDQAIGRVRDRLLPHRDRHRLPAVAAPPPDGEAQGPFPATDHP
jgi:hypothetical protein